MEERERKTLSFGKSATVEEIKISLQGTPKLSALAFIETESMKEGAFLKLIELTNPELERLSCDRLSGLRDEDLVIFSERCQNLKEISFNSCSNISGNGLASLTSNCTPLESLALTRAETAENEDVAAAEETCSWNLTENDFRTLCVRSKATTLRRLRIVNFPRANTYALEVIGQTFPTLTSVDISRCSAAGDEAVRQLISNCSLLETLILAETGISDLSLSLIASSSKALTTLDVSGCPQVSDEGTTTLLADGSVINLRSFSASTCPLITERTLSELFSRSCRSVEEISLRNTNVTKVPDTILSCNRLRVLNLESCRNLQYPPKDVATQGVDKIMDYYQERNLTFRLRVVLLGPVGGGKTSLVHHLTTDAKAPCDKSTDNDSVEVYHWHPFRDHKNESLISKEIQPDERSLNLDIYDVPGRPVCARCIQPFLHITSLPVVVFDISDDKSCDAVIEDVGYIRGKLRNVPIVLVGMHADRILDEGARRKTCDEVQRGIQEQTQNLRQDLTDELDSLSRSAAAQKTEYRMVSDRMQWLRRRLKQLKDQRPPAVIPASAVTTKGFDEVKKAIIETTLADFPHMRKPVKEQTQKVFHQLLEMKKKNVVMESEELGKLLSLTGETGNGNAAKIAEELKFLCDVGVVLTVPRVPKSSPSLVCLDPTALLRAIFAIHVDNPNKSFRFEAKRFWPKHGAVSKPSPGLLVKALEEIALRGCIRESVFPLMWQDIDVEEDQIKRIIDYLVQSCFLVLDTSSPPSPTFNNLVSPKFPGLSPHRIYQIPLLTLMSEDGPTLNWTPEPFLGDLQLGWRFRFLPRSSPGLAATIMSFCRLSLPTDCCKLHWRGGLLLKLGQVFVKLSAVTEEDWCLDVTSRLTTDEEGDRRATEVLWSTTANVLILVHRFLATQSAYRMTVIPCPTYFEVDSDEYDDWPEVPIHHCLLGYRSSGCKFPVTVGRNEFKVDLDLLSPNPARPDEDILSWFTRLSSANVTLSGDSFIPASLSTIAQESFNSSSLPSTDHSPVSTQSLVSLWSQDPASSPGSDTSFGKEKKIPRKKPSLKWNIADDRKFTEEEETKECKRIASGLVAVVVAEAIAKHISEQSELTNGHTTLTLQRMDLCQAVAIASAKAARAAQCGDAAATASAILEAVRAVGEDPTKKTTPSRTSSAMKSKLCSIL